MTASSASVPFGPSILVVAGESSGDQHASGVIREMNACVKTRDLQWFGCGGADMRAAGVELLHDVSELAAIGPWDALAHLRSYLRLFRRLVEEARRRKPSLALLVDFPEFNLRLARRLKALGIPVCYFISPQLWAWRSGRVEIIRKYVDLMLVIFPFEAEYYRTRGIEAHYVGNPTKNFGDMILNSQADRANPAEAQELSFMSPKFLNSPPVVALLPGSRRKEVERLLPIMLDAARFIADRVNVKFWVIKAPAVRRERLECIYKEWVAKAEATLPLEIREDQSAHVLARADCAIIKSGTSTLEATVLQVPFAMAYRLARPSWYLIRPFATTDIYCLTNLIAGEKVVPEFIQNEATGNNIGSFIVDLLKDNRRRERLRERLAAVAAMLGDSNAYRETAGWISKLLLEGLERQ